jgi:aryl-alcohol dehydrogenase-like predicted oxidoreductase
VAVSACCDSRTTDRCGFSLPVRTTRRYEHPAYLDALRNLELLRQRGKIRHLALTNFDTAHLRVVLSCGIKIVSNQICYSCIDMRASGEMAQLCEQYGVKLICFGVLAGGFLSDKYVDMPEPPADDITDWSRMKYRRFFDLIGGWGKLQAVLNALRKSRLAIVFGPCQYHLLFQWPA